MIRPPIETMAVWADKLDRGLPRHPVGERTAARFHGWCAVVCLTHVALGILGGWYHTVGWKRHWVERER